MDFSGYRCFLFDADGTLFDTAELIYQCFKYSLKRFGGLSVTRKQVYSTIGLPLHDQFERYLGPLDKERADEISRAHMDYQMRIYQDHLRIFPGIKEALEVLQERGRRLGVVTSRRNYSLSLFLDTLGIKGYFETLVTPEDTQRHKPFPDPVLRAVNDLDADVSECVYIGDALFDVQSGRAAGMDTVFVDWSFTDPSCFSESDRPDMIIKTLSDLLG